MKKRILFVIVAGIVLISACGQGKQNNTNTYIVDNQVSAMEKSEASSEEEQLVNTISQSEVKSLLKQYFENIGDCSFTITTKEKFHVNRLDAEDSDCSDTTEDSDNNEYDVINTGTIAVTQSGNWFHLRYDADHQIMDMSSEDSNEFFVEKTEDGYAFYGYDRDNDESAYAPLSSVTKMESTDILNIFLSDNAKIISGETVTDKKGTVTGYSITMNMPYSDYYTFFCYGSIISEPEILTEMEDETATAKIQFDKSGKLKQIELTPDQSGAGSTVTNDNTELTVVEEKISIEFADTVSEIDIPTAVLQAKNG